MTDRLVTSDLVLCSMSMVPIGFRDLVESAAGAGFDAVSVVGSVYRRGQRDDGLSDRDMRLLLDDSGLYVSEVESAGSWLSPPEKVVERWRPRLSDEEILRISEALGARTVVATHFGEPASAEAAAPGFAALCDAAADAGTTVSLEFPAWATINDVATAWEIVRLADRPNSGILLDTWHHRRSSSADDVLLSIPPERITAIQLADGAAEPTGRLEEDVLERRMPGEGQFGIVELLRELGQIGVRTPVGIEVWDKQLLEQGPAEAARQLAAAARRVLEEASAAEGSPSHYG
jgi:sugar phosphate isomerase/epimerase